MNVNYKLMKLLQKIIVFSLTFSPLQKILAQGAEDNLVPSDVTHPATRYQNLAGKSGYNTRVASNKIDIVINVIIYALGFVGIFFLIMIIYSGFQWIAAGGNEEIISKAQTRLKNSIIGFVIIATAYGLTVLISGLLEKTISNTYL